MDGRSKHYKRYGRFERKKYEYKTHKKTVNLQLQDEDITATITLLEMAEHEISRIIKRFGQDDYDMKEIYWYYRMRSREVRKTLRKQRGY